MKTAITILALIFATSINAQTKTTPQKGAETKTIIAAYKYAVTAGGDWSGLIFIGINDAEVRFLNKNKEGKEIAEFWNPKVTGEDPDDVSSELHTIGSNVGKIYKLTYTVKKVTNKGNDEGGASSSNENVIVSFEVNPKDLSVPGGQKNESQQAIEAHKLLMADGHYEFKNDEIVLSFSITNVGKTISAKVIGITPSFMVDGKGEFISSNNIGEYKFQTPNCLYEFDLPTDKIILRQSGCKYGEPTKEYTLTKPIIVQDKWNKAMAIDYEQLKLDNEKIEKENSLKFTSNNLFPNASARVANEKGELAAIVENNLVYEIKNGKKAGKAECSELPIKNGNQFFSTQGGLNEYQKIVIDNTGVVKLFFATEAGEKKALAKSKLSMKELKEGIILGKIVKNEFYKYERVGFNIERGFLFKGDKTQAVICIAVFDYFR